MLSVFNFTKGKALQKVDYFTKVPWMNSNKVYITIPRKKKFQSISLNFVHSLLIFGKYGLVSYIFYTRHY